MDRESVDRATGKIPSSIGAYAGTRRTDHAGLNAAQLTDI